MATEIEVANMAAVCMGAPGRLTSLTDDRPVAKALASIWGMSRRMAIRDGVWNFATRRGSLAQLADVPAAEMYPYAGAFKVPAEALRLLEILGVGRDAYQLEGGRVLCSAAAPLYARWLIDVTEPADWDDAFAGAFSRCLAWQAGPKVYGGDFDVASAERAYRTALARAKGIDAKESPTIGQDESGWILARLGYGTSRADALGGDC